MEETDHIYVINFGDNKTFKIGYTRTSPSKRLWEISRTTVKMPNELSLVMSFATMSDAKHVETVLHDLYSNYRVGGEWFKLTFLDLVEMYLLMKRLSYDQRLYKNWFNKVVPADHAEYAKNLNELESNMPPFTYEEVERREEQLKNMLDTLREEGGLGGK